MRDMLRGSSVYGFFIMMVVVVTILGTFRDALFYNAVRSEQEERLDRLIQDVERHHGVRQAREASPGGELKRMSLGEEPPRQEPLNLPLIAAGVGGGVVMLLGAAGALLFLRRSEGEAAAAPAEAAQAEAGEGLVQIPEPPGSGEPPPPLG